MPVQLLRYVQLRRHNYDVSVKYSGGAIFKFAKHFGLHEMQRRDADESYDRKRMELQKRIIHGELTLTEDEVEELQESRILQEQILTALSDGILGRIQIWDRVPWIRSFSAIQVSGSHVGN